MATRKASSGKKHTSAKRRIKAAKKRKGVHLSQRSARAIQLNKPATHVEPVIDREREAALLESAIKEPC